MRIAMGKGLWCGVLVCAWASSLGVAAPAAAQEGVAAPAAAQEGAAAPAAAPKGAATATKWQIEITPYFWAAGFDGTAGVHGVTSDVHMGVGDVLDRLDGAFMGMVEMRKGPWVLVFDAGYVHLKDETAKTWSGPAGIGTGTGTLTADATDEIYSISVGHRIDEGVSRMDVFGGVRYTRIDSHLNLVFSTGGLLPGGTNSVSDEESWLDPFVGFRIIVPFAERWSFVGYADIGGFGIGSVLTSQSLLGVNWELTKNIVAKLGYRYLIQDYQNDDFVWNMLIGGPYLGVGIRF